MGRKQNDDEFYNASTQATANVAADDNNANGSYFIDIYERATPRYKMLPRLKASHAALPQFSRAKFKMTSPYYFYSNISISIVTSRPGVGNATMRKREIDNTHNTQRPH